jgi:hypothetical protein
MDVEDRVFQPGGDILLLIAGDEAVILPPAG